MKQPLAAYSCEYGLIQMVFVLKTTDDAYPGIPKEPDRSKLQHGQTDSQSATAVAVSDWTFRFLYCLF